MLNSRATISIFFTLVWASACITPSPTPAPIVTLAPTQDATPTLSPELESALTQLFWIAAEVAGADPNTPFIEAKTRLIVRLFDDLDRQTRELERLGIDYKIHSPYCINPTAAAAAILDLGKAQTPVEAAPHANRAIVRITDMNMDIEMARTEIAFGEEKGTNNLSEEQLLESLRICNKVIADSGFGP